MHKASGRIKNHVAGIGIHRGVLFFACEILTLPLLKVFTFWITEPCGHSPHIRKLKFTFDSRINLSVAKATCSLKGPGSSGFACIGHTNECEPHLSSLHRIIKICGTHRPMLTLTRKRKYLENTSFFPREWAAQLK